MFLSDFQMVFNVFRFCWKILPTFQNAMKMLPNAFSTFKNVLKWKNRTTIFSLSLVFPNRVTYDHVSRYIMRPINKTRPLINIKVNSQRRSMKGILLLFLEPYNAGARDSEKFIFPDLNKVSVTIKGSPNMLFNNGIESRDAWKQVSHFFMKEKHKPQHMTLQKF